MIGYPSELVVYFFIAIGPEEIPLLLALMPYFRFFASTPAVTLALYPMQQIQKILIRVEHCIEGTPLRGRSYTWYDSGPFSEVCAKW